MSDQQNNLLSGDHVLGDELPSAERFMKTDNFMNDLMAARDTFLSHGEAPSSVRPIVRDAWQRCEQFSVDAAGLRQQTPDMRRLEKAREENRALLESAEPVLRAAHQHLGARPHVLALADRDGLILRLLASPTTTATSLESANIFEGASWHERDIGCNGVGTALVEKKPVILIGPEHFQRAYLEWTCIGIPLRDSDGTIVGVLDFSVPNEYVRIHTWGWFLSVARTIENNLHNPEARRPSPMAAAMDRPDNPMHAVRGVLEFVVSQIDLPPTLAGFLEQARLEARIAEEHMRKQTNELREANRNKEVFLATLAHELASPLSGIQMSLTLLSHQREDPEAFESICDRTERLTEQLSRLLADLRDVSSISQNKIQLEKAPVDMVEVIEHAVVNVRSKIEEKDHDLRLGLPEAPLLVDGDASRLAQVLTNLLTNAVKYTHPGGVIDVTAEHHDESVVIRVRDTGIGISADMLPHVFELFAQAEDRKQEGLGLGLNLVKRLIELHGGSVEAYSDGLDQGSTFTVRLPALSS